jgi:hypothetical protein
MVSELLPNAMKYGYPPGDPGVIAVGGHLVGHVSASRSGPIRVPASVKFAVDRPNRARSFRIAHGGTTTPSGPKPQREHMRDEPGRRGTSHRLLRWSPDLPMTTSDANPPQADIHSYIAIVIHVWKSRSATSDRPLI